MMTASGERIKLPLSGWRKARGLTQSDMAERLGISLITYIRWENDPEKLSIGKANAACKILGIKFEDVIFLEEEATNCIAE